LYIGGGKNIEDMNPTIHEHISQRREVIREFFAEFVDNLGVTFPSEEARQKVINATSDSFSVVLSENLATRDYVESKVIKETSGLATNENLAKLEDKMDRFVTRDYLHSEISRMSSVLESRMLKWFLTTMLAMLAVIFAVLIPLILTIRS